MQRNVTW